MDKIQLAEFVKTLDQEIEVKEGKQYPEVSVSPSRLHSFAQSIKDNEATSLDFLFCLTGVDYGIDLGVIYHLRSTKHGHTLVLKTKISDREHPHIDSVADLWSTADLNEREVYDLLGIKFTNHPDLRRLFLDATWGFPLRKDYVDDINIVTK